MEPKSRVHVDIDRRQPRSGRPKPRRASCHKTIGFRNTRETTNYIRYNTVAEDAYFVSKFTNNKPWGQLVNKQAFLCNLL